MKTFFVDEKRNVKKSYCDLIEDINNKCTLNQLSTALDSYSIFLEIIFSLALGTHIEISEDSVKSCKKESISCTNKIRA